MVKMLEMLSMLTCLKMPRFSCVLVDSSESLDI